MLFNKSASLLNRLNLIITSRCISRAFSNERTKPNVPFPAKKILINACVENKEGVADYEVSYIDTAAEDGGTRNSNQAVTLFIHGTPGNYLDFHEQIRFLASKNIRVVAPTFPEYSFMHKTNGKFRHTPADRSNFALQFLKALNISKIDMLVGHSSGVYPCLYLANNWNQIGSLALINPATHRPSRSTLPLWYKYALVYSGFYKPSYYLMQKIMFPILQMTTPVRIKDIDHPLFAITTIITAGFSNVQNWYKTICNHQTPSLIIFSGNDKLFEKPIYTDLLKLLGIELNQVEVYDEQGQLKFKDLNANRGSVKVIEFEGGTHYCIWKYPQHVNKELLNLLNKSKL